MREIPWTWNTAREAGVLPTEWLDLRGADLSEANLRGANLSWANLREADLSEADLDYSSGIPLCCGGSCFTADSRLFAQFVAHLCTLTISGDDALADECRALQANMQPASRQSHRAADLGLIGVTE